MLGIEASLDVAIRKERSERLRRLWVGAWRKKTNTYPDESFDTPSQNDCNARRSLRFSPRPCAGPAGSVSLPRSDLQGGFRPKKLFLRHAPRQERTKRARMLLRQTSPSREPQRVHRRHAVARMPLLRNENRMTPTCRMMMRLPLYPTRGGPHHSQRYVVCGRSLRRRLRRHAHFGVLPLLRNHAGEL
jgi:hypothetical protein